MAERLMAPVLKTGIPERVSGVRIPLSPPDPQLVLRLRFAALRISARDSNAAQTPQVRIPLSPPDPQLVLRLRFAGLRISARDSNAAQTPQVRIPLSARI